MPRYLVERTFPEGFAVPMNDEGAQTCRMIIENNTSDDVTWLHSFVTLDQRKLFCIYDAPSSEAIRNAASRSNLPVDGVTAVNVFDPYFYHINTSGENDHETQYSI